MVEETLESAHARDKLWLVGFGVITTLLSLVPTAYAALISNSVTLLSDLLRCCVEFLAIFLSWVVLLKISREDSTRYNYGYGKLERLSGLAVGSALLCTFMVTLACSVHRGFYPQGLQNTFFGLLFAILSVGGNGFLWFKNFRFYQVEPSPVIESQWKLFRAKTAATTTVSLSIGAELIFRSSSWSVYFDPIGSFVLSIFLLNSALTLLSNSMADLLDRAVEERVQQIIQRALRECEALYSKVSRVRSRRSGKSTYIDIFLTFPATKSLKEIHEGVMGVKCILERALPESEVVVIPLPDEFEAYSCKLWWVSEKERPTLP
jgi:cation diffusion facilitator family transporter